MNRDESMMFKRMYEMHPLSKTKQQNQQLKGLFDQEPDRLSSQSSGSTKLPRNKSVIVANGIKEFVLSYSVVFVAVLSASMKAIGALTLYEYAMINTLVWVLAFSIFYKRMFIGVNPVVLITMFMRDGVHDWKEQWGELLWRLVMEFLGAWAGAAVAHLSVRELHLFDTNPLWEKATLAELPSNNLENSVGVFWHEFTAVFLLVLAFLYLIPSNNKNQTKTSNEKEDEKLPPILFSFSIGVIFLFIHLFWTPFVGPSLNPFRYLASYIMLALWGNTGSPAWQVIVAFVFTPFAGAFLAFLLFDVLPRNLNYIFEPVRSNKK